MSLLKKRFMVVGFGLGIAKEGMILKIVKGGRYEHKKDK